MTYLTKKQLHLLLSSWLRTFESSRNTVSSIKNRWTLDLSNLTVKYSYFVARWDQTLLKHSGFKLISPNIVERSTDSAYSMAVSKYTINLSTFTTDYFGIEFKVHKIPKNIQVNYVNVGFLIGENVRQLKLATNKAIHDTKNPGISHNFGAGYHAKMDRCKSDHKIVTNSGVIVLKEHIQMKEGWYIDENETLGLNINVKNKSCDLYFNKQNKGIIFKELPNYLTPCLDCWCDKGVQFQIKFVKF